MIGDFATTIATVVIMAIASPSAMIKTNPPAERIIGEHQFSLEDRYAVKSVNEVFKKNILLNLAYLNQSVTNKGEIDWEKIEKPTHYEFILKPGQTFAYHNDVLNQYEGRLVKTTNAHFGSQEGFISDGYLFGDGVCHLASLINWAAQDAALDIKVTKNHDFAVIPDVPKEYGVSIYTNQSVKGSGANNNLYITNNKDHVVKFHFDYNGVDLKVYLTEEV